VVASAYGTINGVVIEGGPQALKRGMSKHVKAGLRDTIQWWQDHVRPKHFRPGAARSYGGKPRSRKYLRRKGRTKHHNADNVWSGRFRRMTALPMRFTGTAKSMKGIMLVPWYVNMVPKTRNAPALGRELIMTKPMEIEAERKVLEVRLHLGLETIRQRRRVRV